MGASVQVVVNGVAAGTDTDWGWWEVKGAAAATYTFQATTTADGVTAATPVGFAFLKKFGGPPSTGIIWPPLTLSSTGPLGSTANATVSGSSSVGLVFYGCSMAGSAAAAAAAGGSATATAVGYDPWEVTWEHRPGRKSYLLVSVTPDFWLAPERGTSGFRLFGSFGEIALSLRGSDNEANVRVELNPGWRAYDDVRFPTVGQHIRTPERMFTSHELEELFLSQHEPTATLWLWKDPVPTLTFIKEVPASTASETVEINVEVNDDDAADDDADDGGSQFPGDGDASPRSPSG